MKPLNVEGKDLANQMMLREKEKEKARPLPLVPGTTTRGQIHSNGYHVTEVLNRLHDQGTQISGAIKPSGNLVIQQVQLGGLEIPLDHATSSSRL